MKKQLLLSLFLLTITSEILPSSQNYAFSYTNGLIKMLLYPFRTLWNSSRTTKITIGAVGALLIAAYKLSPLLNKIIEEHLDEIDANLELLKNILQNKSSSGTKQPTRPTLMSVTQRPNTPEKSREVLIKETNTLISTVDTLGTVSMKQKNRFKRQKEAFNRLKK